MENVFLDILIRIFIAFLGGTILYFFFKKFAQIDNKLRNLNYCWSKEVDLSKKKGHGLILGSWYGNGLSICGEFERKSGQVNYYCITLFKLPIIPLWCVYSDIKKVERPNWKRETTTYNMYGTASWRFLEIFLLYYQVIYYAIFAIGLFYLFYLVLLVPNYYGIFRNYYMFGEWNWDVFLKFFK